MQERVCKKCGSTDFAYPPGRTPRCSPCFKAYMAKWHAEHDVRKTARRYGKCSKCGADKPKGTYCKPCHNAWQRANYQRKFARMNGGREPLPPKGICRKCGGPSSRKRPCKPCRNAYLSDHYESDPNQYAERSKKWKDANPDTVRAQSHRRRAREQNAEGFWTAADIRAIRKKQNGRCANDQCRCKLTRANTHIDHIMPLSKGGTNWPWNLQLLCQPCNNRKWAHIPEIERPLLFDWLALDAAKKSVYP